MKVISRILFTIILIASVATLIYFATSVTEDEFLYENDFETNGEGLTAGGSATIKISNKQSFKGEKSLRVSGGSADWHGARILSTNVKMDTGVDYDISAMLYSENSLMVVMQLTLIKMDGTKEYKWIEDLTLVPGEWTKYFAKINVDSAQYKEIESLSFENKTEPYSKAYFIDDVQILELVKTTNLHIIRISVLAFVALLSLVLLLVSFISKIKKDALTGVYSRDIIENDLPIIINKALSGNRNISLIMTDIDHFKSVNDTYGHTAGDIVLKHFAGIIHQSIRSKDWVSRYGGEEFLIFLPNTNKEIGLAIAERIRSALEKSYSEADGNIIKVTASFGVASLQEDNITSAQEMLKIADQNLYNAKNTGRNQVC